MRPFHHYACHHKSLFELFHMAYLLRPRKFISGIRSRIRLKPGTKYSSTSCYVGEETARIPKWLALELRTNHAGEYGAVQIYKGAYTGLRIHEQINIWIDSSPIEAALKFVEKHEKTETEHLLIISKLISSNDRTRLIPLWHCAGFALGLVPGIFGPRALYWTIAAVETFVEEHYTNQINQMLAEGDQLPNIRKILQSCCEDEIEHKVEALEALLGISHSGMNNMKQHGPDKSSLVRIWSWVVDFGSRYAVELSKKY